MAALFEVNQRVEMRVSFQDNIAALTAVSTGRPTARHKFLPTKGDHPIAPITGFYIDFGFVKEHYDKLSFTNPVLSDIHPYEPIEPYHRSYFTTKAIIFRVSWVFH